jgi:hypothetical protein
MIENDFINPLFLNDYFYCPLQGINLMRWLKSQIIVGLLRRDLLISAHFRPFTRIYPEEYTHAWNWRYPAGI